MALQLRQLLSTSTLLSRVRETFQSIADHRQIAKNGIALADALMSGLAVFALKFPSLLKFDEQRQEEHIRYNLQKLYGVRQAPCDTQLREILDPVEPTAIHPAYHAVFHAVEDAHALAPFCFLGGAYLLSIDAYHLSVQPDGRKTCASGGPKLGNGRPSSARRRSFLRPRWNHDRQERASLRKLQCSGSVCSAVFFRGAWGIRAHRGSRFQRTNTSRGSESGPGARPARGSAIGCLQDRSRGF